MPAPLKPHSADALTKPAGVAGSPTIPATSPLEEPLSQESLGEIVSKDPLHLTDSDVDRIIDYYRSNVALWDAEKREAKAKGRKPNYNKAAARSKVPLSEARAAAKATTVDDLLG